MRRGVKASSGVKIQENKTFALFAFFLAVLAAYVFSAYPGLAPRDGMEIAAYVPRLLPLHQPGYPLYVVTAKAFAWVMGGGAVPYLLNVYSGALMALALTLLVAVAIDLLHSSGQRALLSGLFAGVIVGACPVVIAQAVQAEVFALNSALFAALAFLLNRAELLIDRRHLLAFSFLTGVSAAHHQTIVFPLLAMSYPFWLAASKHGDRGKLLLGCGALAMVGVGTYLIHAWLSGWPMADSETWRRLANALLRKEFGSLQLARESAFATVHDVERTTNYLKWLGLGVTSSIRQLTPVGVVALIIGGWSQLRRGSPIEKALLATSILSGPGFLWLTRDMAVNEENIATLARFMVLPAISMFPAVARGGDMLADTLLVADRLGRKIVVCALLLATAPVLAHNLRDSSRRGCYIPNDFAWNVWMSTTRNATIALGGGSTKLAYQYAAMTNPAGPSQKAFDAASRDFDEAENWSRAALKMATLPRPLASASVVVMRGLPPGVAARYRGLMVELVRASTPGIEGNPAIIESLYAFRGLADTRYREDPFLAEMTRQYGPAALLASTLARNARNPDAERKCRAIAGYMANDSGHEMAKRCLAAISQR
jgi:hypothetical protein